MTLRREAAGVSPAGALGVAFFYHLTRELQANDGSVVFIEREGSASAASLKAAGTLCVAQGEGRVQVDTSALFQGTMAQALDAGALPELLLVCANPDQLFGYVTEFVGLLEALHVRGTLLPQAAEVPAVMLLANGIYFQRVRQVLLEKIEESILLGRLPDLWPDAMPRVIGRWMRGATVQTALREGSGAQACYRPGPRNITTVAGGDAAARQRACALLQARGAWFEDAGATSPTRVEFLKAFLNLNSNVHGLIKALGPDGAFHPLRLRDLYTPEFRTTVHELVSVVLQVGKAVRVFGPEEDARVWIEHCFEVARKHPDHVPSSLQWVEQEIRLGRLQAAVPPTEAWLLNPLIHYARSAGLEAESRYFEALQAELVARLRRALARLREAPQAAGPG